MSSIDVETRKIINGYYDDMLRETDKIYNDYCKSMKEIAIESFKNDIRVNLVKEHFEELKKSYPKLEFDFRCEVYKYGNSYNCEDTETYKKYMDTRKEILIEKRKLILTLETTSKKSEEYKKAIKSFMEKLENGSDTKEIK